MPLLSSYILTIRSTRHGRAAQMLGWKEKPAVARVARKRERRKPICSFFTLPPSASPSLTPEKSPGYSCNSAESKLIYSPQATLFFGGPCGGTFSQKSVSLLPSFSRSPRPAPLLWLLERCTVTDETPRRVSMKLNVRHAPPVLEN